MGYRYLLLDADGTVLDFERSEKEALKAAFESFGFETSGPMLADYHRINAELWEALERGEVSRTLLRTLRFTRLAELYPEVCPEMAQAYADNLARQAFFLPGAQDFLLKAAEKCGIAIVTNGITKVQKGRLGLINAERYAKAVIISDECGVSKPDPALAYLALEKLGCEDKSEALVVGDSVSADIGMGVNAGLDTCLVFGQSEKATYCAKNYGEVLNLL